MPKFFTTYPRVFALNVEFQGKIITHSHDLRSKTNAELQMFTGKKQRNSTICKNNEKLVEFYNGIKENSIPLSGILRG